MSRVSAVLVISWLAASGCMADEEVDPREAELGWAALNRAVAVGHPGFAVGVEVSTDGELEVPCENGGVLTILSQRNELDDFRLDVHFDGCGVNEVELDGALTLVARVEYGDEAVVVVDYDGEVELDGASCAIAASVRGSSVVLDDFTAGDVIVEGHICTYEAGELFAGPTLD